MLNALYQSGRLLVAGCMLLVATGLLGAPSALAQLDGQPMRFALITNDRECDECVYIRASGDIEPYTAAQFRQFVRSHHLDAGNLTVMLHSPGGDVLAGVRLGREFRRFGFNTQVARAQRMPRGGYSLRLGDCASACSYAFLGGLKRFAEDDVLGIHRFFPGHLEPDERVVERPGDEAVSALIKVYALDMGVSAGFIDMSLEVPPADMLYMTHAELRELEVVNSDDPLPLQANAPKER
ncbi:MAG: hypothetical protein AAF739_16760 [Pseudomonadota bacterium]